jgi:hypothetical protein
LETLEQALLAQVMFIPLSSKSISLKQEIFELEVLNRHIKQENEK